MKAVDCIFTMQVIQFGRGKKGKLKMTTVIYSSCFMVIYLSLFKPGFVQLLVDLIKIRLIKCAFNFHINC